jgi:phosphoserine phosphatase
MWGMKLRRRNWSRRNFDELERLLAGVRPGEIAVFDWDNTCAFNDIGEAFLRRLALDLAFGIDVRTMAALLPERVNGIARVRIGSKTHSLRKMKEAILRAYARLKSGPPASGAGRAGEDQRVFASGLLALNRALEETPGIGCEFAYPWMISLHQGLTLAEFDRRAAALIREELRSPIRRRHLADPFGRWRYDWISGIRPYPEMRELAAAWQDRGGRVVVSTASKRQLVERMIAMTGFPCRQVIGMELEIAAGRFRNRLKPGLRPNLGQGKVANIRRLLAAEPVLAAGDSINDYEMLTAFGSTRTRLVIERRPGGGIAGLVRRARQGESGYLAQEIDPQQGCFRAGGNSD